MSSFAPTNADARTLWRELAYVTIVHLALTRDQFTTDDLWERLGGLPGPQERRELGPIVINAKTNRVIVEAGPYIKSTRRENHGRPIPVWKSLLRQSGALPNNVISLADHPRTRETTLPNLAMS